MTNNIVHFEDLWLRAEAISKSKFTDVNSILDNISSLFIDYKNIHEIHMKHPDSVMGAPLKEKTIGKIFFAITALSSKEDIDVYTCLKQEYDINNLQNKISIPDEENLIEPDLP
jgi:hypothetical protein